MSLKSNIDMVKEELSSEEKFFESAVKAESFYKKYKKAIYGLLVILTVSVVVNIVYTQNQANLVEESNKVFNTLISDPNNDTLKVELKNLNPELYDMFLFSNAVKNKDIVALRELKSSKTSVVSDLATYEVATFDKDLKALESYALSQDAIYKDYALVQSAVLLIKDKKAALAQAKLSAIDANSPLFSVAESLKHYGVK